MDVSVRFIRCARAAYRWAGHCAVWSHAGAGVAVAMLPDLSQLCVVNAADGEQQKQQASVGVFLEDTLSKPADSNVRKVHVAYGLFPSLKVEFRDAFPYTQENADPDSVSYTKNALSYAYDDHPMNGFVDQYRAEDASAQQLSEAIGKAYDQTVTDRHGPSYVDASVEIFVRPEGAQAAALQKTVVSRGGLRGVNQRGQPARPRDPDMSITVLSESWLFDKIAPNKSPRGTDEENVVKFVKNLSDLVLGTPDEKGLLGTEWKTSRIEHQEVPGYVGYGNLVRGRASNPNAFVYEFVKSGELAPKA